MSDSIAPTLSRSACSHEKARTRTHGLFGQRRLQVPHTLLEIHKLRRDGRGQATNPSLSDDQEIHGTDADSRFHHDQWLHHQHLPEMEVPHRKVGLLENPTGATRAPRPPGTPPQGTQCLNHHLLQTHALREQSNHQCRQGPLPEARSPHPEPATLPAA